MLKTFAMALVGFLMLDGVWLGLLMTSVYRDQLSSIARLRDGRFDPVWAAVFPVYVLLAIGVAVFVLPRTTDMWSAVRFGALFGLIAYGVYDLTNYSTLAQYPLAITLIDLCWGTFASAVCSAVVKALA